MAPNVLAFAAAAALAPSMVAAGGRGDGGKPDQLHGDFDVYPTEYPCADQNAAAGILLIEEDHRLSQMTPLHFRPFLKLMGEGVPHVKLPCARIAEAGLCGEHAHEDTGYSMVNHLCPRSCGTCPQGNSKASYAGDGTFEGGVDQNDFVAMIYGGQTCEDAQKHGWNKLSCETDAVVRALCGDSCPNTCQRMGWLYEDFDVSLHKIASYQDIKQHQSCAGAPYNRCKEMKYGEAEDACASWGAKLCTGEEDYFQTIFKHADGHFNDGECSSHQRFWKSNIGKPCGGVHKAGDHTHPSDIFGRNADQCDHLSAQNFPACCFDYTHIDSTPTPTLAPAPVPVPVPTPTFPVSAPA